jgi:hypothetical protein
MVSCFGCSIDSFSASQDNIILDCNDPAPGKRYKFLQPTVHYKSLRQQVFINMPPPYIAPLVPLKRGSFIGTFVVDDTCILKAMAERFAWVVGLQWPNPYLLVRRQDRRKVYRHGGSGYCRPLVHPASKCIFVSIIFL